MLSLLAGEAANLFIVGDPDQAIYQFRGRVERGVLFVSQEISLGQKQVTPSEEPAFAGSDSRVRVRHRSEENKGEEQHSLLESWREDGTRCVNERRRLLPSRPWRL